VMVESLPAPDVMEGRVKAPVNGFCKSERWLYKLLTRLERAEGFGMIGDAPLFFRRGKGKCRRRKR
ncbi:MAG: hypothetical protein WBS14_16365, partial [Rhodomicrobium sp.]